GEIRGLHHVYHLVLRGRDRLADRLDGGGGVVLGLLVAGAVECWLHALDVVGETDAERSPARRPAARAARILETPPGNGALHYFAEHRIGMQPLERGGGVDPRAGLQRRERVD